MEVGDLRGGSGTVHRRDGGLSGLGGSSAGGWGWSVGGSKPSASKKGLQKPNVPPERNFNLVMAEKFKFYRKSLKSL